MATLMDRRADRAAANERIGTTVKALLRFRGMTARQLGDAIGEPETTLSKLIKGRQSWQAVTLHDTAAALTVDLPVLFETEGQATSDPVLVIVGTISVTRHWVVTPSGTAPIGGSTWTVTDLTRTERKRPAWAIILCILTVLFFLIGLLFLLVKKTVTTGHVEVSVRSEGLFYATQIPVSSAGQVARVRDLVNQAQTLAAAAT